MAERAESPAVDTRTVLYVAAGLVLFLVAFLAVFWVLFPGLIHEFISTSDSDAGTLGNYGRADAENPAGAGPAGAAGR